MPDSSPVPLVVAVFGASTATPGSAGWADAERCGRLLAELGYTVASGGYGGVMEAVSAGAAACGGRVIGHTAPTVFPHRPGPNPHVEIEVAARTITERIHALVTTSAAVIALPGSLGTFAELVSAWNASFVARATAADPAPVVAVGELWRRLVSLLIRELDTLPDVVTCVDGVAEAVAVVHRSLQEP